MIYSDWHNPWQFFLSIKTDGRVAFQRHSKIPDDKWFSFSAFPVSLNTWTHVAVTCNHVEGTLFLYADGEEVGKRAYFPHKAPFYGPTGKPYMIGNDGHYRDHQFYGSVMDLYVFGTALSLDEIKKIKRWAVNSFIPIIKKLLKWI